MRDQYSVVVGDSERIIAARWAGAGRWAQLVAGLLVYGLAVGLMIRSGLGLGPWDAFHVGLHRWTGLSVGTASIVVGLVIVVATLSIGIRPGPGTIANMVLIGVFVDLVLPVVPRAAHWTLAGGYFAAGIALTGVATGMYIGAGLGKGPRDGLMIGLSERLEWPVRRVRTLIELGALSGGWLMGGKVGVGTVLFTVAIGPATQWGLRLFGISAMGGRAALPFRAVARRPIFRADGHGSRSSEVE